MPRFYESFSVFAGQKLKEFMRCRNNGGGKKGSCINYLCSLINGLSDPLGGINIVVKDSGIRAGVLGLFLYHSTLREHPEIQMELFDDLKRDYPGWHWPDRSITHWDIEMMIFNLLQRELVASGVIRDSRYSVGDIVNELGGGLFEDMNDLRGFSTGKRRHSRGRAVAPRPEAKKCAVHPDEQAVGSKRIFTFGVCRQCNGRIGYALKRSRTNKATEEDRVLISFLEDGQEDDVLAWLQNQDMPKRPILIPRDRSTEKRVHV